MTGFAIERSAAGALRQPPATTTKVVRETEAEAIAFVSFGMVLESGDITYSRHQAQRADKTLCTIAILTSA